MKKNVLKALENVVSTNFNKNRFPNFLLYYD